MNLASFISLMRAAAKRLGAFFGGIPAGGRLLLAVLVAFGMWLHHHDAHIRQKTAASQAHSLLANAAGLKKQVDAELQQANVQNAHAIVHLETERDALARKNQQLAAQLDSLRYGEQLQAAQVAALPASQVVTRVAAQLGLSPVDYAPAATVAAVSTSPGKNDGEGTSDTESAKMAAGTPALQQAVPDTLLLRQRTASAVPSESRKFNRASTPAVNSAAPANLASVLSLTDSGARKVETALVELNSCQAQSSVENQQLSNCSRRAADDGKIIQQQAASIAQLNQALQNKDKMLAQQQTQYQAELRAARGTFFSRFAHASKHVALGLLIGIAIGAAAR